MNIQEYDRLWEEQMQPFWHSSDEATYWNRRAETYGDMVRSSYAFELLKRMQLLPQDSVLDVACGKGVTAIPMAKRVRKVTALDISPAMLETLKQRASRARLHNITLVNRDWNEVAIGTDVEPHDVVLVSRSFPGVRLSDTLRKIDQAATRVVYLTWRVAGDDFEAELSRAIGKEYHPYPDYNLMLGALGVMGISATVEIFDSRHEDKFPSLDDAVRSMAKGAELNDEARARLTSFARARLVFRDGFYRDTSRIRWALISWRK